jgi:hypothetical protein
LATVHAPSARRIDLYLYLSAKKLEKKHENSHENTNHHVYGAGCCNHDKRNREP